MIRKVPLKQFVNLLIRIYEDGYDYVDLAYSTEGERDVVAIQVLSAYIANEEEEEEEGDQKDINIDFDDIIT